MIDNVESSMRDLKQSIEILCNVGFSETFWTK